MPISNNTWQQLLNDKSAFLELVVANIAGWLDTYAAKRTLDLLEYQETNGIKGSLYEVGLFHGKYFSLLARSGAITGSKVVGLDLFEYMSPAHFHAYFADSFSPESLAQVTDFQWAVLPGSSGNLTARSLLRELGGEARFISIDGSHEYDDVLWDLQVAEQVLAPEGIISADDFLSQVDLGVAAAIYHFLDRTPSLVPIASISNKLFLCRPQWADRYRATVEASILADESDPKSQHYRRNHETGPRRNIEVAFRNYRILVIPM